MNRLAWLNRGDAGPPEVLWEDGERRFCRIWRHVVGGARRACFAVVPVAENPSPGCISRLAHEFSLKDHLDDAWALRPLELVRDHGRTALMLEYCTGEPLGRQIEQPVPVGRFLQLAIAVCAALGQLHERDLVHKDIKPANILVDVAANRAWLTGFGVATRLRRERQAAEPPETIAGTLAYMAPEQTGRMNRSIDSRSDLYSLGITLYQMLTGSLPFAASDPMEWVHCHIARMPVQPCDRVESIPIPVSSIVMRLLAKTAEERYQTTGGVEHDLRRCLAEWEIHGRIEPFQLGEHDMPDRLSVPEKLYGRAREIDALQASFDRAVKSGRPELLLVSGHSGIGKSTFVNELHKVLVPPRGLFAAGKFDQHRSDIPYATLAQALRGPVRALLAKGDIEFGHWREELRGALGPNGLLMVNLVPELKLVIGEQPPVPDLPPQDAQRRYQRVLRRLIGVFARPEHPLAVFLDDLQWLDGATLDLIEDLLTQTEVRNLLLIGAYRSNEVSSDHPLMRALDRIRRSGAPVRSIDLAPLAPEHVSQLLADSLSCDQERAAPLAALVHERTAGNPFFVTQFLTALVEEEMLCFDRAATRWVWDLALINAKGYTDNVVDLLIGKLSRLPTYAQEALQQLAQLGHRAEFKLLEVVCRDSLQQLHGHLQEALRAGLVLSAQDSYVFLHDRVQEAAYSLTPEDRRAEAHLRIGMSIASRTPAGRLEEVIFDIVSQLNRGLQLLTSVAERERVAELNLLAGRRAKAATAYASALKYLHVGRDLLTDDTWQRNRDLVFSLEALLAECEMLAGDAAAADARLTVLATRTASGHEAALVTCLRLTLHTVLDRSDLAVDVFLEYWKGRGNNWSAHPQEADVWREYRKTWAGLGERQIETLADLPAMTNPDALDDLDVLTAVVDPAAFTDIGLFALVMCRMVALSLEHGNSDASCCGYLYFGVLASHHFGDYQAGLRFGRLGYDLQERHGSGRHQARIQMSFASLIVVWKDHVRTARDLLRRSFDMANRVGDLAYAAYCCNTLNTNLLAAGDPLVEVQHEAEAGLEFAARIQFGFVVDKITAQLGLIRTLRGLTERFGVFNDERFNEQRFEHHLASEPALALPECWYWIRKLQARFLAGDHRAAVDASLNAQRLLWTSPGFFETAEHHFFSALARAALIDSAANDSRRQHVESLTVHRRQHEAWAQHCPENFENRRLLIDAEIARVEGRELDAERLYEEAIRSARENGFVHNEAIAHELASRFYAARGLTTVADAYLRSARHAYLRWGADGKVRDLDRRFPHIKPEEAAIAATETVMTPVETLDLATVIALSQAMSGEMVIEKLLDTLLRRAIEHAGAERAVLILPRGTEQRIAAEAVTIDDTVVVQLRDEPVSDASLPPTILHYVLRSRDVVILHDSAIQSPFSMDPYLGKRHVRSVLCLPLTHRSGIIGALYLENTLAPRVFAPARAAVLRLIACQAATAIENARLYRGLAEREARIRRLVDHNIVGIAIWHADGRILDINDAFLRIVGYTREEMISGAVRWTDLTPQEWHARDAQALESLKVGGEVPAHEREYVRKDGSRVPVLAAGAIFEDAPDEGVGFVLDLTELKRADAALREGERQSRLILENIPGLVALLTAAGDIEVVNRQVLEYFGQSLDELRQWGSNDTIHPEDLPHVIEVFTRSIAAGTPYETVQRFRRSDGAYRWFTNRGFPVFDPGGRVARWCVLLTDIDERKRAEEALLASERNLRLIIDTIPAMAWSARSDGSADYFNQRFLDFAGFDAEQAKDWGWTAAAHPDDLSELTEVWRRIVASGAPGAAEARLRRYDGAYRWFLFRANPLRDESGNIVRWYGVNTDIDDRKQAEAGLRRAYDSFADAQRLSRTGNFTADIVADEHTWSTELYRIFGMEPGTKIRVQAVRDCIHPDDLAAFDTGFAHSLGGADFDLVFRIFTPAGDLKHVHAIGRLTELVAGRPMFIGAIQDVTERKLAEDALNRARSDLAHVARVTTLSTLTASIAHEVNQPLSGVITNASTCLRILDADPPNVETARETARRIIRDGNRAADVVARLRALFSKKEFMLEALDLNDATREVVALTMSDLQRNRVILQSELAEDLPQVIGDRVQLQQVVLNLLRNASDAMVDVEGRPRHLLIRTEREAGDRVRVIVRDAGVGIAPDNVEKLFEPFHTTKSGGMGIGLSISRSIVERHRGRLWAEPNEGPGATFAFSIPCASPGTAGTAP